MLSDEKYMILSESNENVIFLHHIQKETSKCNTCIKATATTSVHLSTIKQNGANYYT